MHFTEVFTSLLATLVLKPSLLEMKMWVFGALLHQIMDIFT